jgi:hypothetical protein
MSDAVVARTGANQWSILLQEARHALANLRADDLEELATRAECMLTATLSSESIRQRMPTPQPQELPGVSREHRLLGDALRATSDNLKVLRTARSNSRYPGRTVEVDSRWVR